MDLSEKSLCSGQGLAAFCNPADRDFYRALKGSGMPAYQTKSTFDAIITDKLTAHYLQKLERRKYIALALLLFLSIISFLWLLFLSGNSAGRDRTALFANLVYILGSFVGAYWTLSATYCASRHPLILEGRYRVAWLLIGLGLLANGLGDICYVCIKY